MPVATCVISASVGRGGANRRPDVELIQQLMNAVPFAKGGPAPLLSVDGLCGPKTCGAITRFQNVNLGFGDGRVDPGYRTIDKLLEILAALGILGQIIPGYPGGSPAPAPPVPVPVPGGNTTPSNVSGLRQEIKRWAELAANGPYGEVGASAPFGIVSDRDTTFESLSWGGNRQIRKGWKNLKEFFDLAVQGWTEQHWKVKGYLDGVKLPGRRIPQPNSQTGMSWCGIFATWVWIKAGKTTKWRPGVGPSNANRVAGNQGIQVGDMCVQYGKEVHHFVAIGIDGDDILSVNGNSDYQSILIKPMKRSTINYYYQAD